MAKLQTNIYFSPGHIAVIQGSTDKRTNKIAVTKKVLEPLPDGAVLNGVITDEDGLFDAFSKIKAAVSMSDGAVLVLDTTHIIFRLSVMPRVSKKEMEKLVRNEFVNRNMTDKEYIYDYAVLPSKNATAKQRFVLSCAVDKTIIDTYKAFFQRAGVKLDRIDFSTNALLQTLSANPNFFNGENTMVCVVDHYIVSIVNIVANGDIFFHRSRIISSGAGDDYFSEIGDVLYSYRKGVDRTEKAENIYFFDGNVYAPEQYNEIASRLDFKKISVGLKSVAGIKGVEEDEADKYVYNLCAFSEHKDKSLNLMNYQVARVIPKKKIAIAAIAVGITALAGSVAVYMLGIYMDIARMNREIEDINIYINDPGVRSQVAEFHTLTVESAALTGILEQFVTYEGTVSKTPILIKKVVMDALDVFGSKIVIYNVSFTAESKAVIFDVDMQNADEISYFVSKLRNTGLFRDITYMGYAGGALEESRYRFTITCYLSEVKSVD